MYPNIHFLNLFNLSFDPEHIGQASFFCALEMRYTDFGNMKGERL